MSVILPTCDRPQLVGRAVESVLRQTFADLELLLVDNNRQSPRVRANLALVGVLRDPRVRVVEARPARNASSARNAGLAAARGKWITFLDDDDAYQPDKLAAQHALALATGAPLVLCGYELIWPHRRRPRQTDRELFCGDEILTHASLGSPALFHVRNDVVRFDERLSAGEDMLYALRIIAQHVLTHLPCVARPLVSVHQRVDDRSVHANKEGVWRAYRTTCFAARRQFSRDARRSFLARGRLERAMGGHGGPGFLFGSLLAVLRSSNPRRFRLALYALVARLRHGP